MNYRPKSNDSLSAASLLILIVLALITVAVTALGCAWSGTSHSVRFNDYQSEREMGRLPPLPTMANGLNGRRAAWDDEFETYDEVEKRSKKLEDLWGRAEAAEKDGNLRLDRDLLNEYLKETAAPREVSARRNSAFDRLDALTALDRGSSESAVKAYLDARRFHDADKPVAEQVNQPSAAASRDPNLADNFAYLRAAELYKQRNFAEAANAFAAVARQYPHSEKREAALLMRAIATMKTSATYIAFSGNADWDYGEKTPEIEADQAWHDAFAVFQKTMSEYPRGRYFSEARGWLAYLHLRVRDRVNALIQYYRMLGDDHDENARVEATFSLMLIRSPASDDEMNRVEKALANEPSAALAYAYHNVYNYSIDPGSDSPPYETIKNSAGEEDFDATRARNDELEKEWRAERGRVTGQVLTRTLEFSKRLTANYPSLSVGGAFALRAAQASEELDDNNAAVQFAQRALKSKLTGEQREQALWTLGIAQHRLRQFESARKNLATIIRDYPKSSLIEGARRNLAMIAEDAGDIDAALEQYIALKYKFDEGYLVDYLMTPEQLAGFIQKHPDSPRRNELTYALGIRYLRLSRWEDARKTLAQVKTAAVSDYNYYCPGCSCDGNTTVNCDDPKAKALATDDNESGKRDIAPALVLYDVQTANDLEALERDANQAVGDEAKAEALYQYASYQYKAKSLIFYNPLATPGYYNLGMLAGQGRYRAPNESQILFNSQQEHERLSRALKLYLQVATQYPNTKAARDALYTAAVCHERLSNYNPYWRGIYQSGLHAGERMVTYADVKAAYPRYQLPQGTYGWEPSTRTVVGGPGWAPPPAPPPRPKRLTKRERVNLYAHIVRDWLAIFWRENGKRWLTEIVLVSGLMFMVRIARRNHRRLRARLARQRIEQAKQILTYPWFDWFWIDPVVPSRREQIRKLLGDKRQEFIDLARDRRGRPVLVRSIVSHSAVTGLVISLIWTIWCG